MTPLLFLLTLSALYCGAEEEPPSRPSFVYPEADADTKNEAYEAGVAIARTVTDSLLPPYNETRLIEQDKRRNWMYYQFTPGYEKRRREEFRQQYVYKKLTLIREARPTLAKECPKGCIQYLATNYTQPEVDSGSETARLLQSAGMAEFSSGFLSMGLEEMYGVQEDNCNQWEAKYQCLYGCLRDRSLISGMKRQLTGDEHLSVNIECPDNTFLVNLPCIAESSAKWSETCSKRDAAINETMEIIADLKEDGSYKPGFAKVLGVSSRYLAAMEVRDKQRNMCSTYHSFLDCALTGLKAGCSERAASFFHTSVVAHFLERLLPERISVERIVGSVPASCEYLVQKAAYGLMPINSAQD